MQSLGDGLLDAALLARYETFLRPEDRQWKEWESGQLEKIHSALVNFESHTLSGSEFHIGHITLLCALSYLDLRFDYLNWRTSYPKLKAWFEVASQRKSYTKEWALAELFIFPTSYSPGGRHQAEGSSARASNAANWVVGGIGWLLDF